MRPILYLAITNHGFGHATRAAAVAAEIQRLCPDVLLILVTTAPRWLLEGYISGDFILRPRAYDIGVIQTDSITMDKAATLKKLQELKARQASIIASEVNFIKQNRVGLILADLPPLAAAIAQAANIPCYMMSNFGWDFIYQAWQNELLAAMIVKSSFRRMSGEKDDETSAIDILSACSGKRVSKFSMAQSRHKLETRGARAIPRRHVSQRRQSCGT